MGGRAIPHCSRNAHNQNVLVGRAQWGLTRAIMR